MSSEILNARIKIRSKTQQQWEEENAILLYGEIGIVFDENTNLPVSYKIGNGSTTWNNLPTFNFRDDLKPIVKDSGVIVINRAPTSSDYYDPYDSEKKVLEKGRLWYYLTESIHQLFILNSVTDKVAQWTQLIDFENQVTLLNTVNQHTGKINTLETNYNQLNDKVTNLDNNFESRTKTYLETDEYKQILNNQLQNDPNIKTTIGDISKEKINEKIEIDSSITQEKITIGGTSTTDKIGVPTLTNSGLIDPKFLPEFKVENIQYVIAYATIIKTSVLEHGLPYNKYIIKVDYFKQNESTITPQKNVLYIITDTYFRPNETSDYKHWESTDDSNYNLYGKLYVLDNETLSLISKQRDIGIDKGQAYPGELGSIVQLKVKNLEDNIEVIVGEKVDAYLQSPEGQRIIRETVEEISITVQDVLDVIKDPEHHPESRNIISSANILDGTIQGGDIASNTITNSNLVDHTIQGNKIDYNSITDDNINTNANIDGSKLKDNSIDGSKLKDNSVTSGKIANGEIKNQHININAKIDFAKMDADTLNVFDGIILDCGSAN